MAVTSKNISYVRINRVIDNMAMKKPQYFLAKAKQQTKEALTAFPVFISHVAESKS